MAKLVYSAISSLDGYIADDDDSFDWAVPDEEVLAFINDLERPVGTYLYGRRMYEMMVAWETDPSAADQSPRSRDLAGMRHAPDKVVYSGRLEAVSTTRTQMERDFDPEAVRQIKASAGRDVSVSGPDLAAHAFRAGLVDECHLFVAPIAVGSGKRSLPNEVRVRLELLNERRSVTAWSTSATAPRPEEEAATYPADHHPAFEEFVLLAAEAKPGRGLRALWQPRLQASR